MFGARRLGPRIRIAGSIGPRLMLRHPTGNVVHVFRQHLQPADFDNLRSQLPREDHDRLQRFADGGEVGNDVSDDEQAYQQDLANEARKLAAVEHNPDHVEGAPQEYFLQLPATAGAPSLMVLRDTDVGGHLVQANPQHWVKASAEAVENHRRNMVEIAQRLADVGQQHPALAAAAPQTLGPATGPTTLETEAKEPKLFIQRVPAEEPATGQMAEQPAPTTTAPAKLRIVHETPEVLLVQHPTGTHVPLVKSALTPEDLSAVRKMCEGGAVQKMSGTGDGSDAFVEPQAITAVPADAVDIPLPDATEVGMAEAANDPTSAGLPAPEPYTGLHPEDSEDSARLREYGDGATIPGRGISLPGRSGSAPSGAPTDRLPNTPQPPALGYGKNPWDDEITRRLALLGSAKEIEAAATAKQAQQTADLRQAQLDEQKAWTSTFQTFLSDRETRAQEMMDDIDRQVIDPNRKWNSIGAGGKVAAAFSILAGGIGAGLAGGPNVGLAVIHKAIDQDIDSQRDELGKKQTLLSRYLGETQNMIAARALTKSDMLNMQAKALQIQALQQHGEMLPATTQTAIAQMQADAVNERVRAASEWTNDQQTKATIARNNFEMKRQAARDPYEIAALQAETKTRGQEADLAPLRRQALQNEIDMGPAKLREVNAKAAKEEAAAAAAGGSSNASELLAAVRAGRLSPEDVPEKIRQRLVAIDIPNVGNDLLPAFNPKDADTAKEMTAAKNILDSQIQHLRVLRSTEGRGLWNDTVTHATGARNATMESINKLLGFKRLTHPDIQLYKDQVPQTSDIFSRDESVKGSLDELQRMVNEYYDSEMGARVEGWADSPLRQRMSAGSRRQY
jgi:hypothetical protein